MRLTTVIILIAIMQVSASTYAQRLNYVKKNASLLQFFKEIKKQTGYNVVWNEERLDVTNLIDANFKNAELEDALGVVLKRFPLTYTINKKTIILKEKEPSFLDKVIDRFSTINVRGRVTDPEGNPLIGATVKVKGTNTLTVTGDNGKFNLDNLDSKAILVISYLGYDVMEVKVSENMGNIALASGAGSLKEVEVNAGYYTVKDKERTGSISRITADQIEKQPVNNILQAMQANITGLQIIQNSGVPGGGFNIQIRGQNSLRQGNNPFYIIDGVPFIATSLVGTKGGQIVPDASPLASINPNDIESVEVLKDADATAIYGSRGSNGVIIITTKRGKSGVTRTNVYINQGISMVGEKLNLMNIEQYTNMRKEALANDDLQISSTDYDLNGTWDPKKNTDWQKELIGGTAPSTNIQTTLLGGSNNITYSIGGSYYKEGMVFPGNNTYNRGIGNFSLQYNSQNKKLNISFDSSYSKINSNLFTVDLTNFIALAPNYPSLLNDEGLLNWSNNTMYINPIANTQRPYNAKTNNLISNIALNYTFLPELKVKASFGYTTMERKETASEPLTTFSPVLNFGPTQRVSNFANNSINTWIAEAQADYNKKIGSSKLNILIGTTFQQSLTEGQEIRGEGYNSDALIGDIASAFKLSISNKIYSLYRYSAVFGRLNYTFKDKYILNLTGRRDGSSRFGIDNRFANFGAIGAAWIITEEKLVNQNLGFISFAKLRGSFGITGNDQIPDYGYLELWRPTITYQDVTAMFPSGLANPNYAWEENKKIEVALEIGFIKDKARLSLGYYSNQSSNQLIDKQLAPSTGFQSIQDNLPAKIGNTGLEFEANAKIISSKSFNWTTSFNLTIPKNKLIDFPDLETSSYSSFYELKKPLSIKKLYNTYVDHQTGIYAIEDHNSDGIIDDKDLYVIAFNGRKYYGGLQNSLSYKGVTLDFLFQFVKQSGNGFLPGFQTAGGFSESNPLSNQLTILNDHWKSIGDLSTYQKYSTQTPAYLGRLYAYYFGNLATSDASFIRLKNISISYNLPTELTQKIKIQNAKIFMQGQNVFTITKYKGLDPETQSNVSLPILRVFTLGLQFTL